MDSIYLFVISGSLAILGLITLLNNPKQKANLFFFGLTVSTIGWIWVNYLSNTTTDLAQAAIYNKLIFVITSLLVYFLYLFSTVYPTDRFSKLKPAKITLLIFTAVILLVDLSDFLVKDVTISQIIQLLLWLWNCRLFSAFSLCIVFFVVNNIISINRRKV
jgi:hypothetical protein